MVIKIAFSVLFYFAALPRHDPLINGHRLYYDFGDLIAANCTSDMSNPPASLSWYINDEKVRIFAKTFPRHKEKTFKCVHH